MQTPKRKRIAYEFYIYPDLFKDRKKKKLFRFLFGLSELINEGVPNASEAGSGSSLLLLEALGQENSLDDGDLRRGSVEAAEHSPIVSNKARADGGITTVNSTGDYGDLEKGGELIHIADGGLRVDDAALVGDDRVATDKSIVSNRGAEGLYLKGVTDNFLGFLAQVGVEESDVIVGDDAVSKGREALLDALDLDGVGERVAKVLELLIGGDGGDYEAVTVSDAKTANNARAADGGVNNGDVVSELLLENRVEVLAGTSGNKAVSVGDAGEDTDVIRGLEAGTEGHRDVIQVEYCLCRV